MFYQNKDWYLTDLKLFLTRTAAIGTSGRSLHQDCPVSLRLEELARLRSSISWKRAFLRAQIPCLAQEQWYEAGGLKKGLRAVRSYRHHRRRWIRDRNLPAQVTCHRFG